MRAGGVGRALMLTRPCWSEVSRRSNQGISRRSDCARDDMTTKAPNGTGKDREHEEGPGPGRSIALESSARPIGPDIRRRVRDQLESKQPSFQTTTTHQSPIPTLPQPFDSSRSMVAAGWAETVRLPLFAETVVHGRIPSLPAAHRPLPFIPCFSRQTTHQSASSP